MKQICLTFRCVYAYFLQNIPLIPPPCCAASLAFFNSFLFSAKDLVMLYIFSNSSPEVLISRPSTSPLPISLKILQHILPKLKLQSRDTLHFPTKLGHTSMAFSTSLVPHQDESLQANDLTKHTLIRISLLLESEHTDPQTPQLNPISPKLEFHSHNFKLSEFIAHKIQVHQPTLIQNISKNFHLNVRSQPSTHLLISLSNLIKVTSTQPWHQKPMMQAP